MIVVKADKTVHWDVDDTLAAWDPSDVALNEYGIDIEARGSVVGVASNGELLYGPPVKGKIVPHKKHIDQLIKHKLRGHVNFVWSAGGVEWAAAAVRALKLESYVDFCIPKPSWAYDDLPPEQYMPKSKWYKDE